MNKINLPANFTSPASANTSSVYTDTAQLWLRLEAFLSLKSPSTKDTYYGIIKEWCQFLKAELGTNKGAQAILAAKDLHATAYRAWLSKRPGERPRVSFSASLKRPVSLREATKATKKLGLESTQSNATIAKKFAALRRIYRMLIASHLGVTENPFDSDRVPAPPKNAGRKRPTEMLDFKLVKKVINAPDISKPKGLRDQAILAVLFGGGLRRSEAAKLRLVDVKKSAVGTLYLYLRSTKARQDAQQALPKWASEPVLKLLKRRRQEKALDGDFLFISYTGRGGKVPSSLGVSASGIYKLFKFYCSKAGASRFVSPHSARATAITKLLDQGIPHREVQEFSRHSSIQMVELYDKRRIAVDQNVAKELEFE